MNLTDLGAAPLVETPAKTRALGGMPECEGKAR
jgi:hypothetical protein